MFISIDKSKHKKGQGIVEYAVLLAFVVALAMFLNAGGLKGSVIAVFEDVEDFLSYRTYEEYYRDLRKSSNSDLASIPNKKRIKADQEALQSLVQNLIGLEAGEALAELQKLVPGVDLAQVSPDGNYKSQEIEIMRYWDHFNDPAAVADPSKSYITFGNDSQVDAANYLTGNQTQTYKMNEQKPAGLPKKTVSTDRYFYSDNMISNSEKRTITAQLHYTDGKVDSVNVVARCGNNQDNSKNTVADGLNITVTGSGRKGYTVN